MTKKKIKEDPFPYYFICDDCAKLNGGVPVSWAVTCHMGTCEYCNKEKTLCAVTDFNYPKLGKKAIWD
jgi:hypothetical protein